MLLFVAVIINSVVYFKFSTHEKSTTIIQYTTVICFGVALLFNRSSDTWIYSLLIIMSFIVYLDLKNTIRQYHENIICRIFKNDTAICVMGLVSGIKYKLGVAKEGVDFKTVR